MSNVIYRDLRKLNFLYIKRKIKRFLKNFQKSIIPMMNSLKEKSVTFKDSYNYLMKRKCLLMHLIMT
ncbi:hypothetical protein HF846_00765 [Clostridium cadaveris]|uniref:hypothetical protein n=1 Tax=Clostridium cadaveris TaxID=1529 RepID=UPI0015B52FD1|nr:hypothetical protein [Clostridium cadaveris]NME63127.1 hypothetical protein [Clostridium cadaveris]NWK10109.1 hypothetical protein [Clostridium cadaveris]